MAKDIRKTIRLSPDLMEIIAAEPGDSFTEKLESLIWRQKIEIPIREKEIERLEGRITDANKTLNEFKEIQSELNALADHIKSLAEKLLPD